jgi:hypothetical protein
MFIFSVKSKPHLLFLEFIKWILLFCRNIHTLTLNLEEHPKGLTNEIVGLKELKDLYIGTKRGIHPKEVTFVAFKTMTTLLTSS